MMTYYEHVQKILSDAAKGSNPHHNGNGESART